MSLSKGHAAGLEPTVDERLFLPPLTPSSDGPFGELFKIYVVKC